MRVYFAAGQGICLQLEDEAGGRTKIRTFGSDFRPRGVLPLPGLPSRARVSPDGRYGAATVFVTGHAYSGSDASTRTVIVDMKSDQLAIEDLERLEIWRDGVRVEMPGANFWGVTFARDSNRFYATLSSAGKTWLVEGDVSARRVKMLRENVECPSLSPDGTRLAFKKRVGGPGQWRLSVLDLATLQDRALAEERATDDQVEWLDDHHVLYQRAASVWAVDVDGSTPPRVFLSGGASPVAVRQAR